MHLVESSMEFQLVCQAPDLLNHLERASEMLLQLAGADEMGFLVDSSTELPTSNSSCLWEQ